MERCGTFLHRELVTFDKTYFREPVFPTTIRDTMVVMDDERRASIAAALHRYRDIVKKHNMSLVRTLVEALEAVDPPPNYTVETVSDAYKGWTTISGRLA